IPMLIADCVSVGEVALYAPLLRSARGAALPDEFVRRTPAACLSMLRATLRRPDPPNPEAAWRATSRQDPLPASLAFHSGVRALPSLEAPAVEARSPEVLRAR